MRGHVVYESLFGNSHAVAEAVAAGLRAAAPGADVAVLSVLDAPDALRTDLVVVGGPTHAFSLSRPETRRSRPDHLDDPEARRRAEAEPGADTGRGVREWLEVLDTAPGTPAVAFDTRVDRPVPKRASAGMAKRLRRAGCRLVLPPAGFHVAGMHGPLVDGELDRASAWGHEVARAAGLTGAPDPA
ncbi:flavodoxin [Cellulomonas sp. IC4_254]|uniref:flavodoxin n=1 Tax=Cellulomonas sp. IC4_254 TaxID=2714040 RepID=UPI00141F3326|nr:flavodoxin [Cellulomonas sp. IC4_254]NHT18801.1 flavodoxin [Cellulomonas sp. IC4_254]